tara:strand:+ start:493 stop:708 length:216 start_codon:yes stop_codon:yes gene_type:complete
MSIPEFTGFAYLVRNANGHEFLLAPSFSRTESQAKKRLKAVQFLRCQQHRPMFDVLDLLAVEIHVAARLPA